MKTGAIFDMDGLMFDTEKVYRDVWNHLPQEFGFENHPKLGEAVCGTSGEVLEGIVRSFFPGIDAGVFVDTGFQRTMQNIIKMQPDEKPGLHELIAFLKSRGMRLAVASGSPQDIIELNLQRAGLSGSFEAVVSGFSVAHGKPEPDIFLEAARRIGCAPEDCYVFEDGANGIRAGAAAGCTTVMVPDLTQPDDELRSLCAGIYPDLTSVMHAVQNEEI